MTKTNTFVNSPAMTGSPSFRPTRDSVGCDEGEVYLPQRSSACGHVGEAPSCGASASYHRRRIVGVGNIYISA